MTATEMGSLERLLLRSGKVARAMLRPVRHGRLVAAMARARHQGLYVQHGSSFWKYLDRYLLDTLPTAARATAIAHHYRFLDRRLTSAARPAWLQQVCFWAHAASSGRSYRILAGPCRRAVMEGEAELAMLGDGELIATLSFAIAPGALFALADAEVLVIGGIQGVAGGRDLFRAAAKDNHEVAPNALLLLAARAFAGALGIARIIGASNGTHVEQGRHGLRLAADYDRLWIASGGTARPDGPFAIDVAGRGERSLVHLSRTHRKRARAKAAFKARLQIAMRASLHAALIDRDDCRHSTTRVAAAARPGRGGGSRLPEAVP